MKNRFETTAFVQLLWKVSIVHGFGDSLLDMTFLHVFNSYCYKIHVKYLYECIWLTFYALFINISPISKYCACAVFQTPPEEL